jgi:hypothetical protein
MSPGPRAGIEPASSRHRAGIEPASSSGLEPASSRSLEQNLDGDRAPRRAAPRRRRTRAIDAGCGVPRPDAARLPWKAARAALMSPQT